MDMGRGTRLRQSPPGSALGSPLYGMAAYNAAFGGGFGGGGFGSGGGCGNGGGLSGGFDGASTPPMGVSPTTALAEQQHQQQALLRAAATAAAASRGPPRASSASLSQAASGPLPHSMSSAQHMGHSANGLDAFTAAATAAANSMAAAGAASTGAGGGKGRGGHGKSDAESEQACAIFAKSAELDRGTVPALRPANMSAGSNGDGNGKPGSLKGGAACRSIDITVDASPLVRALVAWCFEHSLVHPGDSFVPAS